MAKRSGNYVPKRPNGNRHKKKRTTIGCSPNSRNLNKHKKRQKKGNYRGQGK